MIEVYFLIVGHTHTSIDQYFSVISRLVYGTYFIGSPISLASLLTHSDIASSITAWQYAENREQKLKSKPLLVKKLSVVYDMKTELNPWINPRIKYYKIPHQFRFEKFEGVCTMQYKLFSTQKEFLPARPDRCTGNIKKKHFILN